MTNKKTYDTSINPLKIPGKLLEYLPIVYLVCIFVVFPFYHKTKYINLGTVKYDYYKYTTIPFVIIMTVIAIFWIIIHMYDIHIKDLIHSLCIVDKFVLFYLAALTLSYIFTAYKSMALWGYPGWNMGYLTQLLFISVYIFISRCAKWNNLILWIILAPSSIVFFIAILHRFKIDPFGYYIGLTEAIQLLFLSTLGQATWYSSYLCIILPIGMFLFWYEKQTAYRKLLGAYCAIGFASLVTQNSDSAFIAIGLVFLLLFCNSFSSNLQFKRFLELIIICLGSMRAVGILQLLFPKQVPKLESLSIFCSQNIVLWFVLAFFVILYFAFRNMDSKHKIDITALKWFRTLILILFFICIPIFLLLIILTTAGHLPKSLSFLKNTQYFQFNEKWGNGRGFTWKYTVSMFLEYPMKLKLFGCGPDSYAGYSYPLHQEILNAQWGNAKLVNAHNEWFNALVTTGIFGFISYTGIFISGIIYFIKNSKNAPLLLGIGACLLSYMGHNFFCYQQVICTPIIFIILGIGIIYKKNYKTS